MYTKWHTYGTIVFVSSYVNSSRWSADKEHHEPVLNLFIMKAYICILTNIVNLRPFGPMYLKTPTIID